MGHPPTRRATNPDPWERARRDVLALAGRIIPLLDDPSFSDRHLLAEISEFDQWHLMAAVWQLAAELEVRGVTPDQVSEDIWEMQLSDVDS